MNGTRPVGLGNSSMSEDNPNYRIIEVVQNSEKIQEDLRKPAVTQVEDNQLTMM